MMIALRFIASVLTAMLIIIGIAGICSNRLNLKETKAMAFVLVTQIINIIIILGGR